MLNICPGQPHQILLGILSPCELSLETKRSDNIFKNTERKPTPPEPDWGSSNQYKIIFRMSAIEKEKKEKDYDYKMRKTKL